MISYKKVIGLAVVGIIFLSSIFNADTPANQAKQNLYNKPVVQGTNNFKKDSYSPYSIKENKTEPSLSNDNYYLNSNGNRVHSPAYSTNGVPAGAKAKCRDDTYSFSQSRKGTCSQHGGVASWL
jgi:hypothetical protein